MLDYEVYSSFVHVEQAVLVSVLHHIVPFFTNTAGFCPGHYFFIQFVHDDIFLMNPETRRLALFGTA